MSQINFYILPEHKPLIPFVCQLTETALKKSDESIVIVTPADIIHEVDEMLWSFDDTAFIAHDIIPADQTLATFSTVASVLLTANIEHIATFDGVVINLTSQPLDNFIGVKLLEIMTPDEASLAAGRIKYRVYQAMDTQRVINTYRL